MEIRWGNNKNRNIPSGVREDAEDTKIQARHYANVIDQIIAEHEKEGGFNNLEGKGKPLNLSDDIHENYYLNRVMKNANVLPQWLELQHEIRNELKSLVDKVNRNAVTNIDKAIERLNSKIKKYNRACPSPLLQKPFITQENLRDNTERWE